jgi:hypothetical protein
MDATFLAIVRVALSVLADRVLTIFALWMTFGLALWTMNDPSLYRIYVAGGFALIVFVPSLLKERKREGQVQQEHQ